MIIYFFVFLNIVLLVMGQILWKYGVDRIVTIELTSVVRIICSPFIISGVLVYVAATIVWLWVLSKIPLSLAYPLQSFAYVLGLFAAAYIINEPIPLNRWIGVAIIIIGVVVISLK